MEDANFEKNLQELLFELDKIYDSIKTVTKKVKLLRFSKADIKKTIKLMYKDICEEIDTEWKKN